MGREKVKWFSAPGSKTSSIPLKNPERVRGGGEEVKGVEGRPRARDGGEGAEGGDIEWAEGDKRFGDKGRARVQHQWRGPDCTVEVYMSEESEEGVTVLPQGSQLQE